MDIILRQETESDYRTVEELTREAFWNVYTPGTDCHLLIHNLRKTKEFVKALDIVAVFENKIVGNIVYCEAAVIDDTQKYTVLTFGPISVLPEYQNKGIGGKLIEYTKQLAQKIGYNAILIYGDPDYYKRFGFKASKEFNITDKEGRFPAALLVFELYPNALKNIKGVFAEGKIYEVDEKELEFFEKSFEPKEKFWTESQERFIETSNWYL